MWKRVAMHITSGVKRKRLLKVRGSFASWALERDMAMRRIFWGFCSNWFLIDPLHYLSSRFDFGFEFAEILVIKK